MIDGGAGNDTLNASLSSEVNLADETLNVQPTTESVETINVEARYSKDEVNLDAKNMTGVDTFGSEFSDGDLTIQNVNTLDGNGNARNTSDMTVRMDHTSNFDSVGDASDLTVLFDDDYLLAGEETKDSLQLRIVNNFELAENDSPLTDFASVDFTVAGENVSVDISGAETYQGVADAINAELNEQGYQGVKASVADARTSIFSDDVDSYEQGDLAGEYLPVDIVSTDGDLEPGTIKRASDVADFDGLNTWENSDSVTTNDPISVNVELEKVGRAGQGGNLEIGGKSQTVVDGQANGIQVFDIDVLGNEAQPSNLGSIKSTNDTLETINIATGAEFVGADSVAGLTIRGFDKDVLENNVQTDAYNPFGANVDTINAGEFEGDLTIGTANKLGSYAQNVDTLSATGGGDVEFHANVNEQSDYVYTTGGGNDTIDVNLYTDAIDATGTGLKVNTGGGNDTVTISENNFAQLGSTPASQLSMAELDNVVVNTGGGDDTVKIESDVNAYIDTGAGSDFVKIDAGADNASAGNWTFGKQSASTTSADGTTIFDDRVLYNAELTVTFAGFESTVDVGTEADNFVATQEDINAAIIDAIGSNPELSKLLNTNKDGLNELNVQSLVKGENNLSIDINQPTLVEDDAGDDEVAIRSGDVNGLIAGLIETGEIANSDVEVSDVITAIEQGEITYAESSNGESSDAASTNESDVNFSTVKLGAGSNDLVAFDSNENSANVLEIGGVFGKNSVVNFHDDAPSQVDDVNQVGNHAIDFTAFLDNTVDNSPNNDNDLSEQGIDITLNAPHSPLNGNNADTQNRIALANSVNMLGFDSTVTDSMNFDALSASNLVAALNGDAGANVVTGGLDETKLNAVDNTSNLVGNTQQHIVMVENQQNPGEYKVFQLSSTIKDVNGTDTTEGKFDTNATELGTLDFGASINFNLVGSEDWEETVKDLMADADNVATDGDGNAVKIFDVDEFTSAEDAPADYALEDTLAQLATLSDEQVDGADSYKLNDDPATIGEDDVSAEQAALINGASNSGDYTYTVKAKLADIVAAGGADAVSGAKSYTLTDGSIGSAISVDEAAIVQGADNVGDYTYDIEDELSNILAANDTAGGNIAALAGADTITVGGTDSDLDDETITLKDLAAATDSDDAKAGTAINFQDSDAATLTSEQLTAITDAGLGLTDDDDITVTGVTADNAAAVADELGKGSSSIDDSVEFKDGEVTLSAADFSTVTEVADLKDADQITVAGVADTAGVKAAEEALSGNDTIQVANEADITLTSTELGNLEADLTVADTESANLTVSEVSNADSLTATDLVDTFDVSGLTTDQDSATIADFAMGDQIETGVADLTAGEDGTFAADGAFEYFVSTAGDDTTITYEIADTGSSETASVTLTGVQLTNSDVSVDDNGVFTYEIA